MKTVEKHAKHFSNSHIAKPFGEIERQIGAGKMSFKIGNANRPKKKRVSISIKTLFSAQFQITLKDKYLSSVLFYGELNVTFYATRADGHR